LFDDAVTFIRMNFLHICYYLHSGLNPRNYLHQFPALNSNTTINNYKSNTSTPLPNNLYVCQQRDCWSRWFFLLPPKNLCHVFSRQDEENAILYPRRGPRLTWSILYTPYPHYILVTLSLVHPETRTHARLCLFMTTPAIHTVNYFHVIHYAPTTDRRGQNHKNTPSIIFSMICFHYLPYHNQKIN
jgi:hypothetical protein